MHEPNAYQQHVDVMTLNMRRNYIRDRTQAALTYITECGKIAEMEKTFDKDALQQRIKAHSHRAIMLR